MGRRPANVTQADIARAIRAAQAAGLPVQRIVVRADGVSVETAIGASIAESVENEVVETRKRLVI